MMRCFSLSSSGSGSLLLVKGAIQSAFHVSMAHLPNCLWRQGYEFGDTRRAQCFCQWQERHGAQYGAHWLNSPVQKLLQCPLILL